MHGNNRLAHFESRLLAMMHLIVRYRFIDNNSITLTIRWLVLRLPQITGTICIVYQNRMNHFETHRTIRFRRYNLFVNSQRNSIIFCFDIADPQGFHTLALSDIKSLCICTQQPIGYTCVLKKKLPVKKKFKSSCELKNPAHNC